MPGKLSQQVVGHALKDAISFYTDDGDVPATTLHMPPSATATVLSLSLSKAPPEAPPAVPPAAPRAAPRAASPAKPHAAPSAAPLAGLPETPEAAPEAAPPEAPPAAPTEALTATPEAAPAASTGVHVATHKPILDVTLVAAHLSLLILLLCDPFLSTWGGCDADTEKFIRDFASYFWD